MHQKRKLEKYFTTFHLSIFGLLVAFVLTFVFKYLEENEISQFADYENPMNKLVHLSCPDINEVATQNGKYICKQVISRNSQQSVKIVHNTVVKREPANVVNAKPMASKDKMAIAPPKVVSPEQVKAIVDEKCQSFDSYLKDVKLNIQDLPFSRINEKDLRVIVRGNTKIYKATLVATCAKESLSLQEICEEGGHPIVSDYLTAPALKKFLVSEEKINEQKRSLASVGDYEMQGRLVEVAFDRAMRVCKQLVSF